MDGADGNDVSRFQPSSTMNNVSEAEAQRRLIQQYLDENQLLIAAIMENQNQGLLENCAKYQAKLQNNLLYLASLADFL